MLTGLAGVAVGMCLLNVFLPAPPEPATAIYERSDAFVRACEAAGAEVSRLRRATFFIDDCSTPVVTPIFGEEGQVIVRRTVEGEADDDDGGRVTYSVKMDGLSIERWRPIEIRLAPSRLTLDASLLPTTRSATPTSAHR